MAVKKRRSVNPFETTTTTRQRPPVKGKSPGPIPKSERYQPKDRSREAADEESTAFRGVRVGEEMPPSRRNRAISDAALLGGGLTAAQARMRGVPIDQPDDDGEQPFDENDPADMNAGADPDQEHGGPTPDDVQALINEAYEKGRYDMQYAINKDRQVEQQKRQNDQARERDMQAQISPPQQPQEKHAHPATQFEPHGNGADLKPQLPAGTIIHTQTGLLTRLPTVVDIDSLWDWIRHDPDLGAGFLGRRLATSIELHTLVNAIRVAETQGIALIRSVAYQDQHLGFVLLAPILAAERTALMHIYLREDIRGQLHTLIGPLIEIAQQGVPNTTFAVYSADAVWARLHRKLLLPLGFTEQTMFIRTPATAQSQGKSVTMR